MGESDKIRTEIEIERLRQELDAETRRCLHLTSQLDHANAEFEAFVSTAAHNLRESLREVAILSELLAEPMTDAPRPDEAESLNRIRAAAAKMQLLLSDVVDFWTTRTSDRQPVRTDMEAALQQALVSTDTQIREGKATVTHDALPPVIGDFLMLTKVWQHLIRNAIEYCSEPVPRIHISFRRAEPEWVFTVEDNGPGIEPEFQGLIFGAFKRLHGPELPGNGLGLAFCRMAVEWHGGRIWVESVLGKGSKFHFTLPIAD
jgi:light-regulated signal transduction histidine kinase (bacteriophytochrome)